MISLEKVGNAIKFTFTGNDHYLQDGTIEVPLNSLMLVTDESDMFTLKKSATNDIFISGLYSEIGMSKSQLESWFKENAVGAGGTDEEKVQEMIDASISGKADVSDLNVYADSVKYNPTTKYVEFYHNGTGGTKVFEYDASAFVIDGMVENVEIKNGNLVITFNTDAGKQNISIPISEIFDANNYYNKAEIDVKERVTSTALNDLEERKQDTLVSGTNIKTINNESILGSGNINIQGGGKAIEAGRGISITTGETADTVSFDLPISATTLGLECLNSSSNSKTGNSFTNNNFINGSYNKIGGNGQRRKFNNNFIWGSNNKIIDGNYDYDSSSSSNIICGYGNVISGVSNAYTSIFGYCNESYKGYQRLFGYYNKSINQYETSFGNYNNSVSASTTFGDSGNTLFSVGNGTSNAARHNAFEIRQNGDIYITLDGQDVKLQDQLGGGSITVDTALDSGSTNPVENRVIYNKIDEVEQVTAAALNNINDRLSEDEEVTAAGLNAVNDKFDGLKLKKLTQAEYDALTTKDSNTLYIVI